jgi:hypothetical protein
MSTRAMAGVCADHSSMHMRSRISGCAFVLYMLPLVVGRLVIASAWHSACKGLYSERG